MFLIMDQRAFSDVDDAVVLDTAQTGKEACELANEHGGVVVKDGAVVWEWHTGDEIEWVYREF